MWEFGFDNPVVAIIFWALAASALDLSVSQVRLTVAVNCEGLAVLIMTLLVVLYVDPGSSSSALGLQSLGLSGQAPSSSSLDAGTLSDTTASGNEAHSTHGTPTIF